MSHLVAFLYSGFLSISWLISPPVRLRRKQQLYIEVQLFRLLCSGLDSTDGELKLCLHLLMKVSCKTRIERRTMAEVFLHRFLYPLHAWILDYDIPPSVRILPGPAFTPLISFKLISFPNLKSPLSSSLLIIDAPSSSFRIQTLSLPPLPSNSKDNTPRTLGLTRIPTTRPARHRRRRRALRMIRHHCARH